jgi:hypothetical protein
MEQTSSPPSSPNNNTELGCGNVDTLLATDSDEETDATLEEDLSGLLSESEEEKESPELPLNWADDE